MRLGVLTGGGDCPGLNAVIRAVVRKAERSFGDEIVGFLDGWRGLVDDRWMELNVEVCRGLLPKGGTILGSSRTNPSAIEGGLEACQATLQHHGIDALIAIGGEDTLGMAHRLTEAGSPVVGVPKTIDNDLSATEFTFGFQTAVQIATDAIDRLHTTAESHHRVLVCEVMGRHAGWIAAYAGIAGGAAAVLVPERLFDIDQLCASLTARHELGNFASVVVVAEGAAPKAGSLELAAGDTDAFGHVRLGGIGAVLATEIEKRTGYETRATVLGHIQRGGTPNAFDRVLATRFGVAAVEAVHDGSYGTMVALQASQIVRVPLAEAVGELKTVDPSLLEIADLFSA
ncbi:MAG: ATP-dependent 6-phosphofructokinase [Actinobacteria bacterium]|nr:ATP-dependent 6-phosphofructokinase [Actinomycetota bacterium]